MSLPPRPQKFRQDRAITDPKTGNPTTEFLRSINGAIDLLSYLATIQEAADNANAAAEAANAAAAAAQGSANSTAAAYALANSYPTGLTITAVDVGAGTSSTINISAHNRVYATTPPTTVAVNAGSITGLTPSTRYYIYYDQPSRAGGAVTYVETTTQSVVAQVGNRHSVGTIVTPAPSGGPSNGGGTTPPGGSYDEP